MASEAVATSTAADGLTPAQKLMEQHDHHATVEEVVDEEDVAHPPPPATLNKDTSDIPALSEKAAGKQKAEDAPAPAPAKKAPALNTASEESFPALGPVKPRAPVVAPTWGNKPASVSTNAVNGVNGNGVTPSTAASRASTPASGVNSPASLPLGRGPALPTMNLPGKQKQSLVFDPQHLVPRNELKKPMAEIIRDINKRSKAKLDVRTGGPGNKVVFEAYGPNEAVREVLKEAADAFGRKLEIAYPIPASTRPFIIGRGGAKIQEIQKRTGARINVPKQEEGENEDDEVKVVISGNSLTAEMARREIEAIVNERTATVNLRLKDIPAEFYPFLAGPHERSIASLENGRDVNVRIPHYHTWDTQAPPQTARNQPIPFVPQAQFPIQISGDRVAAQEVQAKIEQRVRELRQLLAIEQCNIERGRHQFIVGERGGSLHDFLQETGCSIILPPSSEDTESIYVVGPRDRLQSGIDRLEDIAAEMTMASADCAREHRGANAQAHADAVTRYLRHRSALAELERAHEASIVTPTDGSTAWQIYAKNGKNSMKARSDIMSIFAGHPPARFSTVDVDPFYHEFLQQQNAQHIRDTTGVHVVFPDAVEESPSLILVFEGQTPASDYAIPRGAPSDVDKKAYKQGLQQAQDFVRNLTSNQQEVISRDVETSPKFHQKIQRFADREQQGLPRDQIPVQMLFGDRRPQASRSSANQFGMRGPTDALEALHAKILAFIEQEEKDELERGYTTSFDFPQKFANYLIGKRGDNIKKLRDEFDVDIQVNDGKVELKGPQAKANACKSHILNLAKRLEDEATHTLKIKPEYHRELIGAKGSTVNRLQDRYHVRINFPRSTAAKNDDEAGEGASQRNFRAQAPDEVVIRGPRKGADEARDEILNLLQYTIDNSHSETISVAQSQIPQLIGTGGREMESLRTTTKAQIDVPGAREGADPSGRIEIKIKGTKQAVQEAKKILQERVKVFDDTVVKTIDIDRKYHKTLIGTGGSNIHRIVTAAGGPDNARELARMVRFPRADSEGSSIRVEGPKTVVENIVAAIQEQASTLENQITEVLEVSPDKHRLLIGRGGETRRQLESKLHIQLDIPKQTETGAARSQVKITGKAEDVEKAKEHILELVKGQEGETIQVPRYLHHIISDNGQFFRRLRNDHKVTVDHAGQQIPSKPTAAEGGKARKGANGALPLITDDTSAGAESHSWEVVDNNAVDESVDKSATIPWVLRGNVENLPKARQALQTAMENASKPSSTGYLILPDPRSYRLVVGPGGSTINNIRKKTGTKVQVPRDQAKDEAIEIVGSGDGCEQARQMILDIIAKGGNGGNGRQG
ncbi:hypothetical protein P280DRAFT_468737 [Massarina eburnea CBS 473.64]|uniref:K Homology domain-containing protein n=1 Tax=Massarina eburnea CBS 473.64 TaxID=1395130 RepID=A0A6A6S0H1_9PLEO|nr:hypothetical protein P280DRAFT_468737 [Massarina eburnea CBS 473.64]